MGEGQIKSKLLDLRAAKFSNSPPSRPRRLSFATKPSDGKQLRAIGIRADNDAVPTMLLCVLRFVRLLWSGHRGELGREPLNNQPRWLREKGRSVSGMQNPGKRSCDRQASFNGDIFLVRPSALKRRPISSQLSGRVPASWGILAASAFFCLLKASKVVCID